MLTRSQHSTLQREHYAASGWVPRGVSRLFIARIAGAPLGSIAHEFPQLISAVDGLLSSERQLEGERENLSQQLYDAVSACIDKDDRRALIQLRRALYNLRQPTQRAVDTALRCLPECTAAHVQSVIRGISTREDHRAVIEDLFPRALAAAQQHLVCAVANEDFQKALALSSESLYRNLPRYLQTAMSTASVSRTEQIERGLLRYASRMATKATPFARFCGVVGAELQSEAAESAIRIHGDLERKRGVVRLNKRIYSRLWQVLEAVFAVRDRLLVEVNPTLVTSEAKVTFLTVVDGKETFQRMAGSEILAVLLTLTGPKANRQRASLASLVTGLASHQQCDCSSAEARAFIDQAIAIGLLRLQPIVGEQDADWAPPLAQFLGDVADPIAQVIAALLNDLVELAEQYRDGSVDARAATLRDMRVRLRAAFAAVGARPWSSTDLPVFEDTTADSFVVVNERLAKRCLDAFATWVKCTAPLARVHRDMAAMRHFFDSYYAADVARVPLLGFYEDYFREHYKQHLEVLQRPGASDNRASANPFDLECVRNQLAADAWLTDLIRERWSQHPSAEEITLTSEDVAVAVAPLTDAARQDFAYSVNAFCQIFGPAGAEARLMLRGGQYFIGFGKYFSRFLYLLPERWERATRGANQAKTEVILAEICGDSSFNANLHPPMLDWEIAYPISAHGGAPNEIPSSDLVVERDPNNANSLTLTLAATGRRVCPLDMGFLSPMMRPPLFQMLARFSPFDMYALNVPSTPHRQRAPEHGNVLYRPRVTFEDSLVLARRSWLVPASCMPRAASDETECAYYLRVAKWRTRAGIPERVYVRVMPGATPPQQTAETQADSQQQLPPDQKQELRPPLSAQTRPSADFQKPQYINFADPLFVRLFSKLPRRLSTFSLIIEECLPEGNEWPVYNGNSYALEFVLQADVETQVV